MTERFELTTDANTDEILLIIDHQDKVMWSFLKSHEEAVQGVYKRLNEQDLRIKQLEESLGFCRDLLDGTCNSTRMKQLHETIEDMVKQSTSDNGRFKVWQVPPIKEGTNIGITTTNGGGVTDD